MLFIHTINYVLISISCVRGLLYICMLYVSQRAEFVTVVSHCCELLIDIHLCWLSCTKCANALVTLATHTRTCTCTWRC